MRTDAKDLALSVFQRQKERCVWPPVVELPQETSCEDDDPPVIPGMAGQGSTAMEVNNTELIHRKWLHLSNLTHFVRSSRT